MHKESIDVYYYVSIGLKYIIVLKPFETRLVLIIVSLFGDKIDGCKFINTKAIEYS